MAESWTVVWTVVWTVLYHCISMLDFEANETTLYAVF